jgi:hypothetical protein
MPFSRLGGNIAELNASPILKKSARAVELSLLTTFLEALFFEALI